MCSVEYSEKFMQYMTGEESNDRIYTKQLFRSCPLSINTELPKTILCYGQYYYARSPPSVTRLITDNNTNISTIKFTNNQNKPNLSATSPNKSIQELKSLVFKKNLFKNTIWDSIHRHNVNVAEKYEEPRVTVELHEEAWIKACNESWDDDTLPIIPIDDNKDNNNPFLYIKIIKIWCVNAYIGIGIKYDTISKSFLSTFYSRYCVDAQIPDDIFNIIIDFYTICQPSAIYLDRNYIQNQLSNSNSMDLSRFKPFISNLIMSNNSESEHGEPIGTA